MSRIIILMLMISTIALASDTENAGTDIVQRTVNFLLFAGLIWYLIAEPVKNYFASRSQAIADEMKKVQDKLKAPGIMDRKSVHEPLATGTLRRRPNLLTDIPSLS